MCAACFYRPLKLGGGVRLSPSAALGSCAQKCGQKLLFGFGLCAARYCTRKSRSSWHYRFLTEFNYLLNLVFFLFFFAKPASRQLLELVAFLWFEFSLWRKDAVKVFQFCCYCNLRLGIWVHRLEINLAKLLLSGKFITVYARSAILKLRSLIFH